MEWYQAIFAIVGSFLLLAFLGIPINFALGLSFIPLLFFLSGEPSNYVLNLFGLTIYRKLQSFGLVAAPLFIFMGQLFYVSGVGMRLYKGFQRWLGWVPGGLAVATITTTTVFAAIVGASMISASTLGPISIPSMTEHGYNRRLAVGSLCAGATLAMLIPPSIPFIFYCIITESSIGELFIAGLIPGLMLSAMFIALTVIRVIKNPSLAPAVKPASWKEKYQAIPWMAGPLGLVFLIIGALYLGIAGVNELAAIGALGAIVLGLAYRELDWHRFFFALIRTSRVLGFFGLLVACACFMGFGFTYFGISAQFTQWVVSLDVPRVAILAILVVMYLGIGMILDAAAIVLITMPIIFPVILVLGYDPIWFGVLLILTLEVGAVTPPVGVNLFALKLAVPGVDLTDAVLGSLPYLALVLFGMVLLVLFPNLALWLPSTMY